MRLWLNSALRLLAGAYFVLTSLYCLLAFLPYTYTAFIKAPPYPWMPWFAHHQAGLYWIAAGTMVAANWPVRSWFGGRRWIFAVGVGLLAAAGIYLSIHPFLQNLQSNRAAYGWSLAALAPVMGLLLWTAPGTGAENELTEDSGGQLFGYSAGILAALVVSVIYLVAALMRNYRDNHAAGLRAQDAEFAVWSVLSHMVLAIAVVSVLNLIYLFAAKGRKPRHMRVGLIMLLIMVGLFDVLARFLDSAMSFDGRSAVVYAWVFAQALTLWGFSLLVPHVARGRAKILSRAETILTWAAIVALTALALASRWLIGGEDWNGFVASTWALAFWIAMSLCSYRLRPARANYSGAVVLGTLLTSAFLYGALRATEIFWAKPLGSTDDEISLKLEEYGERDASFQLAHHVLGNGRTQTCGDLCRILREYTNVRDTHITAGVRLVDNLAPAPGDRPNIFIFVIDSMRPDYLGAYNPEQVHYTPNLDALARDSVVIHHAFTQYAGTSLSEPAIWSGALLLHTHFPQPFDAVNSLRSLARTDGYQLMASYDTVLRQLISPSDELTKLDADKQLWNQYEACSTVEQLESALDTRQDKARPVLFYTQPMNVHQFARNDVPSPTSQNWQSPAGMNARITYEVHWVDGCLGGFFDYLKKRGVYDNSIIIVTSDHGDATGEFGRTSHSTSIWPEIMRVPLIIHLPPTMREHVVYDDQRISTLTDIAPSLYYLLGHRPIQRNPLYGRPLFAETRQELDRYPAKDLLLASDVRAVYGILSADGRYLYTTYDSPSQSYLFDLSADANAEHSILTPPLKQRYDEEIIEQLHVVGNYYGYRPGVGSLVASVR